MYVYKNGIILLHIFQNTLINNYKYTYPTWETPCKAHVRTTNNEEKHTNQDYPRNCTLHTTHILAHFLAHPIYIPIPSRSAKQQHLHDVGKRD